MFQQFTVPQADWTATLVKIRQQPARHRLLQRLRGRRRGVVHQAVRQSPTKSLVYQQYAPSIPQYLQLAGGAANGVVWSTVVGILQNDPVADAVQRRPSRPSSTPGRDSATRATSTTWCTVGPGRVEAGRPIRLRKREQDRQEHVYRGVCGTYCFPDDYLTCYPYPDHTKDPSLGMPHLTFQIQNGKQVLISPDPYTTGSYQLPSWL